MTARKKPKAVGRAERKFENYNPAKALDLAYCIHVVDDKSSEGTASWKRAEASTLKFGRDVDSCKPNTPDGKFLSRINEIVVSLSRGITRGKFEYANQLRTAREEKDRRINDLKEATFKNGFVRGWLRAMLVGGLGFVLMKAIAPNFEAVESNSNYVSFAAGIGGILMSTWIQSQLINYRIVQAFACYELATSFAYRRRNKELKVEYERAKAQALDTWHQYTGRTEEVFPTFELVLREEEALEQEYRLSRYELTASPFAKLWSEFSPGAVLRRYLQKREEKKAQLAKLEEVSHE